MSMKDRLERKKYMGVCRWELQILARMMSKLPSTATTYMDRKRQNRRGCSSGSPDTPRRRNSAVSERFQGFTLSMGLLERW